tara:strand:- start:288 stop:1565 length:1278 start_codon:yes stop_codon:yes gene_type:complete
MATEGIKPLSTFYGTHLQATVNSYSRLSDRIAYSLGYPMINIELHTNQLYEYITMAAEMYTKFAGYTEEFLIFDSNLYEQNKGIRMDRLFSITPELNNSYTSSDLQISENNPNAVVTSVTNGTSAAVYTFTINDEDNDSVEYAIKMVDDSTKHSRVSKMLVTSQFSSAGEGAVTYTEYGIIHTSSGDLLNLSVATSGASGQFVNIVAEPSNTGSVTVIKNDFTTTVATVSTQQQNFGSYDVLTDNYRKVVDVYQFEEGSTTGVNTLFTIEQTLAQQTYFSYAMGQYGFDLISWYTVREFLETREKLLSQRRSFKFNPRTQYMQMYPQPLSSNDVRFYGIVGCYVEQPLQDVLKEPWVHQYSTALAKIGVGRVRGKYTGTSMFGGGTLNYQDLLQEGLAEKEKLEQQLFEGTPGFGDAGASTFFVG